MELLPFDDDFCTCLLDIQMQMTPMTIIHLKID